MIGIDFYIFNVGGLGMVVIGVGGVDVVDVMVGMFWEFKMFKVIGVKLIGKMSGWIFVKDVIFKVVGILIVKGGIGVIVEYFGDGVELLFCIGKGMICNMGVEIGVIILIFGYDEVMGCYLCVIECVEVVDFVDGVKEYFIGDVECYVNLEKYFDQVIEINLFELELYINGFYILDLAWLIFKFVQAVKENNYL